MVLSTPLLVVYKASRYVPLVARSEELTMFAADPQVMIAAWLCATHKPKAIVTETVKERCEMNMDNILQTEKWTQFKMTGNTNSLIEISPPTCYLLCNSIRGDLKTRVS